MTLQEWVYHCRDAMTRAGLWFGHGTDNAQDEAAWLVLAAIGAAVDKEFTAWGDEAGKMQATSITELLRQRIESRAPLAYIIGEAWFCGLRFIVNEHVLVPRSPIAELIPDQFEPWIQAGRLNHVLDLCTGSGCIAIATALQMPWCKVDATDLSAEALTVAESNRELHGLGNRLSLIRSDLFEALAGRKYDLVLSNPPYVGRREYDDLPSEYHAEPGMGLLSSMMGLEIPLRILQQSTDFLTPEGVLICEVGENAQQLQSVLPELPLTWLEFAQGGDGVFTIDRERLEEHRQEIGLAMERLSNVA